MASKDPETNKRRLLQVRAISSKSGKIGPPGPDPAPGEKAGFSPIGPNFKQTAFWRFWVFASNFFLMKAKNKNFQIQNKNSSKCYFP